MSALTGSADNKGFSRRFRMKLQSAALGKGFVAPHS